MFTANGYDWQVKYSGTGAWTVVNTSTYALSKLAFGDFNNDGEADVFRTRF